MPIPIASADDPRVADYRAIPEPALLRERGIFIAEGRLVVQRLLEQVRIPVRSLLVNEAALEALRPSLAARAELPVYVSDTVTLSAIGGFNFHRGCLAVGERIAPSTWQELAAHPHPRDLIVVVEGVTQADNVGSLFRNAAAFGARAVLLDPAACDPLYRKALRTSLGTALTLPSARSGRWPDDLDALKAAGWVLAALTPSRDAQPIERAATALRDRPIALLAGAEGHGLSSAALARADIHIGIRMAHGVDSLNVGTATGIALYALTTARVRDEAY